MNIKIRLLLREILGFQWLFVVFTDSKLCILPLKHKQGLVGSRYSDFYQVFSLNEETSGSIFTLGLNQSAIFVYRVPTCCRGLNGGFTESESDFTGYGVAGRGGRFWRMEKSAPTRPWEMERDGETVGNERRRRPTTVGRQRALICRGRGHKDDSEDINPFHSYILHPRTVLTMAGRGQGHAIRHSHSLSAGETSHKNQKIKHPPSRSKKKKKEKKIVSGRPFSTLTRFFPNGVARSRKKRGKVPFSSRLKTFHCLLDSNRRYLGFNYVCAVTWGGHLVSMAFI